MSHIEIFAYRTNISTMQTSQLRCFIADRKYILSRIFYVYFKTKIKITDDYMNLFYYTCKLATTAKGMGGDSLPIRPQVDTRIRIPFVGAALYLCHTEMLPNAR